MHVLLRKLLSLHPLSDEEQEALLSSIVSTRQFKRGDDIVSDGSTPDHTTVMLQGIACRYKNFEDGRRQILTFQYPGDITDLYSYVMKRMDHAVGALTVCEVGRVPHAKIRDLCETYPNLAYTLWRDTLTDTSKSYASIMSLGARTAKERLAHLLAEQYIRMVVVDELKPGQSMEFGITQSDLAEATGLSLVHVNKTLKKLKDDGLLSWNRRELKILDWEALKKAALFEPDYLHFTNVPQ